MKLYLDACCYNRPFDDQFLDRIRVEAEAVLAILGRVALDEWQLLGSEALDLEVSRCPDVERRVRVLHLIALVSRSVQVDEAVAQRSHELVGLGLHTFDALHVACAETGGAGVFLTTDDRVLRWAARHKARLSIRIANPAEWFAEATRQ